MANMAKLKTLHHKLQTLSQKLGVNFRLLRYNGVVLSPNPYIKNQSINSRTRTQAVSQTVSREGFEGFQVYLDVKGLEQSGIAIEAALAPAATWEISEDEGTNYEQILIFNKPVRQSSRYIATFLKRISGANLIIYYPVQTGGTTPDEDGNPVPNASLTPLECIMGNGQGSVKSTAIPGVTEASIFLEGRCSNPKIMPVEVKPLRQFNAELINPVNGASLTGRFIIRPTAQDAWGPDTQTQGSKISGWFTINI